jgi:hypothetical protein
MSVVLPKDIDISKIKYSEIKVLPSGGKSVYINYNGGKMLVQTPILSVPYGANDGSKYSDVGDKKYDITVSFRGHDENAKIKMFHDKLKEIENKVIDDAFTNRQPWFKDDFDNNRAFVARMFTPIVKIDKDKDTGKPANKFPPTFKAKMPYNNREDKYEFDSYNMDGDEIDMASIIKNLKGAKTQLVVQLTGIWIIGSKFGCSWKVVIGKFQLSSASKVVFLEDSDTEKVKDVTEDEDEDDDISVDNEVVKNLKSSDVPVEEEDDEEEEEEEVEEDEPVPSPPKAVAPVKKAVKKAK